MATKPSRISTIVRNLIPLFTLRLEFLLGGRIAPEAMARKAATLFATPFKSSRTRALATPTLGARETELDIDGDKIHVYVWGDPATQPYVLFAHGWSSHGTRITPWVAPLLDAGYAVVTFESETFSFCEL